MLVLAVIVVFALSGVNVYAGVWTSFVFVEVCVFLGLTFIPKVSKRYRGVNQVGCILCAWSVEQCTIIFESTVAKNNNYYGTCIVVLQMVSLYRDPQGKKIFDGMDSASYHVTSTIPSTVVEDGRSEH